VKASIVNVKGDAITYRATVTVTGPEEIEGMVFVEAGEFVMGCHPETDSTCTPMNKPPHPVKLTHDFYIGQTTVTQAQWNSVMGSLPTQSFPGDNKPVTNVSWNDAQTFIAKLNERDAGTGKTWHLPTEAQWEFAARGGNASEGHLYYSGSNDFEEVAWWSGNSGGTTHDVATKSPNELGIFDMTGNVQEWVADIYIEGYGDNSYREDPDIQPDPGYDSTSAVRIIRNGRYRDYDYNMMVFYRQGRIQTLANAALGFRLALTITEPSVPTATAEPTFFESASKTVSGLWDSAISGIKSLWNSIIK
jgi:formylglycine-generating enzyme required for sulfatase activity